MRTVLVQEYGYIEYAFVLNVTGEQAEDLYLVLVPPDSVAKIEISRIDAAEPPLITRHNYYEWHKKEFCGGDIGRRLHVLQPGLKSRR